MKLLLFLELCVIFASSFLLTTQLFYNCLNETHFLIIAALGVFVAGVVLVSGYSPGGFTVVLYAVLAMVAFGYLIYTVAIGYIVYNFGPDSRAIFIENDVRGELKSLPKYAERSKDKYGSYKFVCRSESFAFLPGALDVAYQKESCFGPLAFLIFDTERPEPYSLFTCNADENSWAAETNHPGRNGFLCIDTKRQVLYTEFPLEDKVSCQ